MYILPDTPRATAFAALILCLAAAALLMWITKSPISGAVPALCYRSTVSVLLGRPVRLVLPSGMTFEVGGWSDTTGPPNPTPPAAAEST